MGYLVEAPGLSSGATEQSCRDELGHRSKRIKLESGERSQNRALINFGDPAVLRDVMDMVQWKKFGSATPAMHEIYAYKWRFFTMIGFLWQDRLVQAETLEMGSERSLEMKKVQNPRDLQPVVILDSDDEDEKDRPKIVPVFEEKMLMPSSSYPLSADMLLKQQEELLYEKSVLQRPLSSYPLDADMLLKQQEELLSEKSVVCKLGGGKARKEQEDRVRNEGEGEVDANEKDNVMLVDNDLSGEDTSESNVEDDGLGDIWNQMGVAVEMIKDDSMNHSPTENSEQDEPDCDHSYLLKDDIGYVCRVCGVVSKGIESIIDIQYKKSNRSRNSISRGYRDGDGGSPTEKIKVSGPIMSLNENIVAHPTHYKQMKPHQIEGFNFLKRNLLDPENPGGCILAHAPGSGKTFMIISFMQSFLAKYSDGRPLVVLPKGILSTWKKEFLRWQIEDTLLLDFYSMKADNRAQQLEILRQWKDNKSILFLGYKSFAKILTDSSQSVATVSCQEILINLPSIMILDEGHTPRNENTDVLHSVAKVKTPRKVVLSGTLYQNHVREVFNIFNLVRPKFLKLESSKEIRKKIMSCVQISGVRKQLNGHGESAFFELVEYALQEDEDHKRKSKVILYLRDMTSTVLHYYRGDFLDELPGLVDFSVLLKLTPKQKIEVDKLKKAEKKIFKRLSVGCAIYLHPILKELSDTNTVNGERAVSVSDDKIDEMIGRIDIQEGAKAKFFMTMLRFCEAAGEKLLVFSQYLPPLKFLERLAAWKRGWRVGKEMFTITGDSTPDQREFSMDTFNKSPDARVFFGSIKACGEGISLVGASRIIILDVHLNPSVSRQAIGRAFRPGQKNKVFVYRLVAADSPEEDDHLTCFKKELIAKRWFESDAHRGLLDFEMEEVDLKESGDTFFDLPHLAGDVKLLHKR